MTVEEERELLILTRENNLMLKEILDHVRECQSQESRSSEDMRQFCINVAADIFVEAMEDSGKDNLKKTFTNNGINQKN